MEKEGSGGGGGGVTGIERNGEGIPRRRREKRYYYNR